MANAQEPGQTPNHSNLSKTTSKTRSTTILIIAAAVLIIAAAGIYFAWKKKNNGTTNQTADQIRNLFTATTTPNFTAPAPGGQYRSFPTSTEPATAPPVAEPQTQAPANNNAAPAQPSATIYRNLSLGFQITVPYAWTARLNGSSVWFFNQATGATEGYVESYPAGNATLADLLNIFQHSPSIRQVGQISLNGQPALRYLADSTASSGVALIMGGKIFYLTGNLANPAIAATLEATGGKVGY